MSDKISELLDMNPHTITMDLPVTTSEVPAITDNSIEDTDFAFARNNQYELINQGKAAVNTAMKIAAESENPRAIEVLADLFKNVSEMNRQLITMSKDLAEIKIAKTGKGSTGPAPTQIGTQQNILFTGNSSDLNKLLAEKLKQHHDDPSSY